MLKTPVKIEQDAENREMMYKQISEFYRVRASCLGCWLGSETAISVPVAF